MFLISALYSFALKKVYAILFHIALIHRDLPTQLRLSFEISEILVLV